MGHQLVRTSLPYHRTRLKDHRLMGYLKPRLRIMGGHQHRCPRTGLGSQGFHYLYNALRIEIGAGLIANEGRSLLGDDRRKGRLSPLAAR